MTEEGRKEHDRRKVAAILVADVMCTQCLADKASLELDAALDALRAIERHFDVVRTWGRCRMCQQRNHAVLTLT